MVRTKNEALHERRKTEIVAAAARCFARKGVHQTTMQEICEVSGISAGALYRYFPSKDAIIVALAEEERDETRELTAFLARSGDIVSGLVELIPELVTALTDEEYGRLAIEIGAEAARNPTVAEAFERNEADLRDALGDALRRGQADGFVDGALDVDGTVFLLMALLDGVSGRSAFALGVSKDRLAASLGRLVRRMLSPPSTGSQP